MEGKFPGFSPFILELLASNTRCPALQLLFFETEDVTRQRYQIGQ